MRIYSFVMLSLCLIPFQAEGMDPMDGIDPMDAEKLCGYSRKKVSLRENSQEQRLSRSKRSLSVPSISQTSPPFQPVNRSLVEKSEDFFAPLPQMRNYTDPHLNKRNSLPLSIPSTPLKPSQESAKKYRIAAQSSRKEHLSDASNQYYNRFEESLTSFKVGDTTKALQAFKDAESYFHLGKIVPMYLPKRLNSKFVQCLTSSYLKIAQRPNFKNCSLCKYYFRQEEEYFLDKAHLPNISKQKVENHLWKHIIYAHLADTGEHLQISPEEKKKRIKKLRNLIPQHHF